MKNDLIQQSCNMLADSWHPERVQVESLTPDGSLRRFFRMIRSDGSRVIGIAPPVGDSSGLREASSAWQIGRHLFARGIAVPELYGFDNQNGLLLCEDLGDVRLHELVLEYGTSSEQVVDLYRRSVVWLARMQVRGRENFDCSWCWDTERYDREVMLKRESGYFLQALCRDMLNLVVEEQALQEEFIGLADRAEQADASFFMHRDFQSRNIMLAPRGPVLIDFQDALMGPAVYDLVALLRDSYVVLDDDLLDELIDYYLELCSARDLKRPPADTWRRQFDLQTLQRKLKDAGRFVFIERVKNNPDFLPFIAPSLAYARQAFERLPEYQPCRRVLAAVVEELR